MTAMGAEISGAGTGMITIQGVEALHGADFTVSSDRIEAGSMALVVRGDGRRHHA